MRSVCGRLTAKPGITKLSDLIFRTASFAKSPKFSELHRVKEDVQQCILIVDDDPDDYEFLMECLIEAGVTSPLEVASDGPAAFKLLDSWEDNLPQLIILDVNMPMMNGVDFLSKLNSLYSIPVIMYTTTCDEDLVRKAKELGAIDCVKKGTTYVDSLKFAKRVAEIIGNCKPVDKK